MNRLFDIRCERNPDTVAAVQGDRVLHYRDLRVQADLLAARLREAGVVRGDRVGVCGSRSLEALVAFLGVLKAGAVYVPFDGTVPSARARTMAVDADVRTAVILPGAVCRIRRLHARVEIGPVRSGAPILPNSALIRGSGTNGPYSRAVTEDSRAGTPDNGVRTEDAASVMFTSASTGRPKPVAVPHAGVVHLTGMDVAGSRPSPGERVLHGYDLSSDASTIEIWTALLNGACLVLIDRAELISPQALESALLAAEVDIAYLTTSAFHHVARVRPAALASTRFASAGGEAMDPDLARAVLAACPGTSVVNFYGPTENTVVSTAYPVRELSDDATTVPIGKPVGATKCRVVRPDGRPAASGEQGELLLGGKGLALGYLGDAELTAERFVAAPGRPEQRWYRTGDLVSCRPDGNLEYCGRVDRQVKIRGHRIELEEVESLLHTFPEVGEAVVEVHNGSGSATMSLVAYVAPSVAGEAVPIDRVRTELARSLPASAVPSRIFELPEFPVAANGKVDRRRLPALVADEEGDSAPAEVSDVREALRQVWESTLGVRPGDTDDFFALGGDSLLAAEVVNRTIAVLGMDPAHGSPLVRRLLNAPTLAGYSTAVRRQRERRSDGFARIDFDAEARLGFSLPEPSGPAPRWESPRHVVLTGASGFVGAFLLDRLLRSTAAVVHCLVRADTARDARHRVLVNLERYDLHPPEFASRVECLPADIATSELGLADDDRERLGAEADLIVHSAAQVNFLYPYEQLRGTNVDGTREIIRLAAPRRVPLHFVSTIAVVAGFGTAGVRHVAEDTPLAHADRLSMGYAESKWVAEKLVQQAADQGLPIAIHRPYEVTGDQRSGACNTETAICSLFKTVAETGVAPDIALPLDFVPVDTLAAAIVQVATGRQARRRVYHMTNPQPARFADMLDRMLAAGYAIRTAPYQEWVAELVRYVGENPTSATAPFLSLCVDRGNKADISVKEMYFDDVFPRLGRNNAQADLAGLRCPPVDADLLDRYLEYFVSSGYIDRPTTLDGGIE